MEHDSRREGEDRETRAEILEFLLKRENEVKRGMNLTEKMNLLNRVNLVLYGTLDVSYRI